MALAGRKGKGFLPGEAGAHPPCARPVQRVGLLIGSGVNKPERDLRGRAAVSLMKRVLIVEDQALNRELLVQLLSAEYEVDTASNGQEALDRVSSFWPDVVVLDLSLPVMDGWTVASRLKSEESTRSIPILALTAHAMAGDREQALQAGCDYYMTKPFQEENLFTVLRYILAARAAS